MSEDRITHISRISLLAFALAWVVASLSSLRAESEEVAPGVPTEAEVRNLIGELEADDYRQRMGAQAALLELTSTHAPVMLEKLVEPYLKATDPDLRARLRLTLWNAKRSEMDSNPVGFVGIQMQDNIRQVGERLERAVQVVRVFDGTAARKNDLRIGDLISAVDGRPFGENELPSLVFKDLIGARTAGDDVELTIVRGPHELKVKIQLGKRPPMDFLGYEDDEQERMKNAFNAFLRAEAEKRGLSLPLGGAPEVETPLNPSPGSSELVPRP